MNEAVINEYKPDSVSPPGTTLVETLQAIGMTQAELAERTGRPKKTINEIIKGKAAITPKTALQLERVLGIPANFWNNREQHYRETLAKQDEKRRLEKHVDWLKQFPVQAMVKWEWIQSKNDKVEQLNEVLKFFGISSPRPIKDLSPYQHIAFRQSTAFQSNVAACAAWLRKGVIDAQEIGCQPYSTQKFKDSLIEVRSLTNQSPEHFHPALLNLCANSGVAVVFVPELPRIRLWGATRWLGPQKALIQLCLRYKTDDHLWFTFFHEAAHIYLHAKRDIFIESGRPGSRREREADQFATDMLIPAEDFQRFLSWHDFSGGAIIRFANDLHIAPGIVIGRLQHDKLIPFSYYNNLKRHLTWA